MRQVSVSRNTFTAPRSALFAKIALIIGLTTTAPRLLHYISSISASQPPDSHTVTPGDNQIAQIVVNEIHHTVLVVLQRRNQCARTLGNVKHRVITSCKPPLACRGATPNETKVDTYYGTDPLPHINPTLHDDSPSIGVSVGSPHRAAADVKNVPPLRFAPV